MAENEWTSLGENRWTTLGENSWPSLGENVWTSLARKMTERKEYEGFFHELHNETEWQLVLEDMQAWIEKRLIES